MAVEELTLTYTGPAVADSRMDVRELAPALLAVADAIAAVSAELYPNSPAPGIAVIATEAGSFRVVMKVTEPTWLGHMVELLSGDEATAAANLIAIVGTLGGGIALIKWLKRRRIARVSSLAPDSGRVLVILLDGDSMEVDQREIRLVARRDFLDAVRQIVAPLEPDQIDAVTLASDETRVEIPAGEKASFEIPPAEGEPEEVVDSTRETLLHLVNVAFTPGHKWKVREGSSEYWVEIADDVFADRVDNNLESFASGDLLRVRMHERMHGSPSVDVKIERQIVNVVQHIRAQQAIQSLLPPRSGDA